MKVSAQVLALAALAPVALAQSTTTAAAAEPSGSAAASTNAAATGTGQTPVASGEPVAIPSMTPELQKCFDALFTDLECKGSNDWQCFCQKAIADDADEAHAPSLEKFRKCVGSEDALATKIGQGECVKALGPDVLPSESGSAEPTGSAAASGAASESGAASGASTMATGTATSKASGTQSGTAASATKTSGASSASANLIVAVLAGVASFVLL